MNLLEKCQEHRMTRLKIKTIKDIKELITAIFEKHQTQGEVLTDLYRTLIFPDWDRIKTVKGYPECGVEMWKYICRLFMEFDKKFHLNVMPGGLWMNTGFSSNRDLDDWEISFNNCSVEYEEVENVERTYPRTAQ